MCAECRLEAEGKRTTEKHHPFGRKNDHFTVDEPANVHAVLSDMQEDWPEDTLRNPRRSPLRRRAAAQRAARDTLCRAVERLDADSQMNEELDEFLVEEVGENWPDLFRKFNRRRPDDG
jgi:hypothetical protein